MPHLTLPRELQHVAVADEIGGHIGLGMLDAVPDARLGPEMDDAVAGVLVHHRGQSIGVREIDLEHTDAIAVLLRELIHARSLECGIVIVVEIVDADHVLAALEKRACRVRSDEPRSPGNKNSHDGPLGAACAWGYTVQGVTVREQLVTSVAPCDPLT